jgi:hypothetical protein
MAYCKNCQKTISCSCQIRTASDGKTVCSACIREYENSLVNTSSIIPSVPITRPDDIPNIS